MSIVASAPFSVPSTRLSRALLLHGALLALTAAAAPPSLAQAPQAAAARTYDIAAGSLASAISRFAAMSGAGISFDPAQLQGLQSQGLQGRHTLAQGFALLLRGSDWEAEHLGNDNWVLRKVARPAESTVVSLDEVKVVASQPIALSEGSGSYTTGLMSSATGMALSMRETPQSVSVVTRQRIDDERLETLDDVLKATTGITASYNGSERANWYSRGERIETLQVDGLPMSIADGFSADSLSLPATVLYDRVEVTRGANGLLQGSGSPSAAINMVRKRPTKERQVDLVMGAGSWAQRSLQLDAGGAINEAGTLRARGVAYTHQSDSFRDTGSKDNRLLYGIVEADLTPSTMLTAGLVWQDDRNAGYDWGGLSTRVDGSFYPFSPKVSMTPTWAHLDKRNLQYFAELTQRVGEDWKLTVSANRISSISHMLGRSTRHLSVRDEDLQMRASRLNYDDQRENFGVHVQGRYSLLGRKHELMLGANLQKSEWFYDNASVGAYAGLNPFGFNPDSIPYPSSVVNSTSYEGSSKKDTGVYVATRLDLPNANKLILGGRLSWVDYKGVNSWSRTPTTYKATREFTPYVGLVHDISDSLSVYASYTEIFKPQSNVDVSGTLLPAVIGSNYEAGLKQSLWDDALNASVAVFRTDQTNLARAVATRDVCFSPAVTCYEAAGKIRNQGVEFDISGELARGLQLATGYTYNQSRNLTGGQAGQPYNTQLPRHTFRLSAMWRLPAHLSALRVGANVQAQSGIYQTEANTGYQSYGNGAMPYRISQNAYAIVGLVAAYQISSRTELQLNIGNLFDKRYYSTIGGTNWGNFMGAPRSAALTLRMKL